MVEQNKEQSDMSTKDDETMSKGSVTSSDAPPEEPELDEKEIAKAEEYKQKGNDHFKDAKFDEAIEMYSEAIYCKVPNKKKAIYYSNRALVNLKLENYAVAMYDAQEAIKHDPSFTKAYYRRGSAYVALN